MRGFFFREEEKSLLFKRLRKTLKSVEFLKNRKKRDFLGMSNPHETRFLEVCDTGSVTELRELLEKYNAEIDLFVELKDNLNWNGLHLAAKRPDAAKGLPVVEELLRR